MASTELIKLKVGGRKFETTASTLAKYPKTLLGQIVDVNQKIPFKKDVKGYIFFDRNSDLFDYILDYYRTGKIVCPNQIAYSDFVEELRFWLIEDRPKPDLDQILDYQSFNVLLHNASLFEKSWLFKFYVHLRGKWLTNQNELSYPLLHDDAMMLSIFFLFNSEMMERGYQVMLLEILKKDIKRNCDRKIKVEIDGSEFELDESQLITKDGKTYVKCLRIKLW